MQKNESPLLGNIKLPPGISTSTKLKESMEKEMISKRSQIFMEMVNKIAIECGRRCVNTKGNYDFSMAEKLCVSRCSDKMLNVKEVLETHIGEVASPIFYAQYFS